ncbi:MAG: lysylphosphatidylglycerol synthase transmembrane domain-containing protein [Candidatus Promineifilaceae bacterium]|nr:lysylphosphatidylglycerol synthase transmembrane domain-containing protein [Candidatus Promineifilaceae bacterium]
MIAEKGTGSPPPEADAELAPLTQEQSIPWLRLLLGLLLGGVGLFLALQNTNFAELRAAVVEADFAYVLLGLVVISATMAAKSWRWRMLFPPPAPALPFSALFWSLSLGQLVNTAIPFVRLGEVARVYQLGEVASVSRARALGTLVVEKVLEMMTLVVLVALLLPFFVLPRFTVEAVWVSALAGAAALVALFLLAAHPEQAQRLASWSLQWLPAALRARLLPLMIASLEGLAALRSRRALLGLLGSSLLIGLLSILTPLVLFPAFDLAPELLPAATLHAVLMVGTLPPSTPAKVGVFEFLVVYTLRTVTDVESESLLLAYALIFHLVVILPQIIFGGIAAVRGGKAT